ncbi:RidA family protein [Hydrogenimonas thermophila]|uniref:RidA family protein n=1 Tax=Hydrogenimonas thermophila TaxID=223786 RepID=UPI002936F258|nr:RidA family protein [Hydrogenimonas thermophila]WOE70820.1 RidA family protein [Hydrogenimonas thermophila]WOE73338.1 RidA family protein [Hydrogenimonas thermophila]
MKIIQTDNAPQAIGPYSQAMKVGDFIFTSGQIALTPSGVMVQDNIELQTEQVMKNLQAVLEAAGSCLQNVVKTTIFLANMDDFATVNAIYEKWFDGYKPARSTVAVKTLPKNALVEIECIALVEAPIPG